MPAELFDSSMPIYLMSEEDLDDLVAYLRKLETDFDPGISGAALRIGTALPTQREALQAMGCLGAGKVRKLAEIVAGTVLAGEISLAAAISSLDWVSSHDQYGRNDPRLGA